MTIINVVNRTDNSRVISVAQMIDIQSMADLIDAVFHIQTAGAVRISLVSDGKADLVCNVFNKTGWIVVDGGFNSTASGVPQDNHPIGVQILLRIVKPHTT